jgi:hypothetical protein
LKRDMPFEIPAGAVEELECVLDVPRAGEFNSQIHLYLDDLGLREIIILVEGKAHAK